MLEFKCWHEKNLKNILRGVITISDDLRVGLNIFSILIMLRLKSFENKAC